MLVSPADFELEYITNFFQAHLDEFEHLEGAGLDSARVIEQIQLAASMRQALLDIRSKDGGLYHRLPSHLNSALNAEERLSRFLANVFSHFEISNPNALVPNPVEPYPVDLEKGFRVFELDEYIDYLEERAAESDLEGSLPSAHVRAEYAYAESQLIAYLQFIVSSSVDSSVTNIARRSSCVCLLRDTLLLYLGLRRLRRAGWDVDAHAVLASRALLQRFTPDDPTNPLYDSLFDVLFGCLSDHPERYCREFLAIYLRLSRNTHSAEGNELRSFLGRYCERRLSPARQYLAIDTGVHGNMPLLMMTASPLITGFRLYTCVPWLQEFFGDVLFTRLSATMRYMEALVCQEFLFHFSAIDGDRILIKESQDANVRAVAYGEIRRFLRAVEHAFLRQESAAVGVTEERFLPPVGEA